MCLNSTKTTVHWRHGDGDIEKFKYFCFQHSTDMTIPPSPKTSQLTVFTQTHDGFHHAAVVTPELAPGSSGLTLTTTACCFLEEP